MDIEDLWDIQELIHKPLRPPRAGHIGEYVFAEKWEALMNEPDKEWPSAINLHRILYAMPVKLEQSHATVAASLICWLGTNCGQAFLWEARRMAKDRVRDAYVAAWGIANRRIHGINSGVRIAEHLLAPEEYFGKRWPFGEYGLLKLPELSADDYEVLEHVAHWLGTDDGKKFCAECEAEIQIRQDAVNRAECERVNVRLAGAV